MAAVACLGQICASHGSGAMYAWMYVWLRRLPLGICAGRRTSDRDHERAAEVGIYQRQPQGWLCACGPAPLVCIDIGRALSSDSARARQYQWRGLALVLCRAPWI